ncbi:MAG TPA: ferric reductase-like transmembrane domain-containing protein, partial [Tepidiformaceae bacterium]|nr:ferric reductase-like transmembrane domain-containing protein [Tepidiformaceae bacterium]
MNIPWYLARAAGLTAYLLLFVTVVLGLSIRTKGLDRYIARWKVTDIHIFLSLLVLGFAILHAGVLLWDGFVGYSLLDILVPFSTGYRTVWTAVGIVTLYALLVITLSFPARRYIGYRAWRMLHYATFGAYVAALLHAIYTGTDSRVAWAQVLYIATAGTVLAMLIYRIAVWARRENALLAKRGSVGPGRTASASAWFAAQEAAMQRRGIETRALRVSLGAVCLTALVFIAAGLGPFRWGRGGDNAPVDALAQGDAPFAGSPFNDTFSGTASEARQSPAETRLTLQG